MNTGCVFDIKRFTVHDGPGIRTSVFFKGCPLGCLWCHNPESQSPLPEQIGKSSAPGQTETIGAAMSAEQVLEQVGKDIIFYDESHGGVTFSGGEPLYQPEFLATLLQAAKRAGLHTALDTSGFADEAVLRDIMPRVDLFLYDIKLLADDDHRRFTGVGNGPILANFELLRQAGKRLFVRFVVIPGVSDTPANLAGLAALMAAGGVARLDLLPYHPLAAHKYRRLGRAHAMAAVPAPTQAQMDAVRRALTDIRIPIQTGG
jgi:pyruvate formate lyase activating enzyme